MSKYEMGKDGYKKYKYILRKDAQNECSGLLYVMMKGFL